MAINSPPTLEPPKAERDIHRLTDSFIARYPPPHYTSLTAAPKLQLPVLLPQCRPGERSHGFTRAYAPVLEDCGVDQAMFLDFPETFSQASQASLLIQAINLAGFTTHSLPFGIGIAVQAAITIAVKTSKEIHSRNRYVSPPTQSPLCYFDDCCTCRTNTFLDKSTTHFPAQRTLLRRHDMKPGILRNTSLYQSLNPGFDFRHTE